MVNKRKNIGSSALVLSGSKIINLMLSMITSMLLSRYLSLAEYGTYSELQMVTSLVVSIFALGLPNSINYFLASCDAEFKKKFLTFYYFAITVLSIIVAGLMFFSKNIIAQYYKNPSLVVYSFFLAIIPWTKMIISSRSNMLIVDAKLKRELVYSVTNSIFLLLVAIFTILGRSSLYIYLWIYVIVEILFSLLTYMEAYFSSGKISFNFDKGLLKSIIVFSVPLGVSTAISTISLDLDKLIIGFFLDEEAVAIYANAGKELPFSLIASSFTALVLPKVVKNIKEKNKEEAINLWKNSSELCFIILSFCAFASVIFAPQIITLLYSETYLQGTTIFRIYSLVLLFRITYWGMLLNAYGKTKQILYNSLICLLLNTILSVALYFLIGFEGPALASLISIGCMSVALVFNSSRITKVSIKNIFPWNNIIKDFFICALTAIIFFGITNFIEISNDFKGIIWTVIIGFVWALLYFFIMFKRLKQLWQQIH